MTTMDTMTTTTMTTTTTTTTTSSILLRSTDTTCHRILRAKGAEDGAEERGRAAVPYLPYLSEAARAVYVERATSSPLLAFARADDAHDVPLDR